ncbi:MAG: hypothetical protein IKD72_08125 [Clostridia bacterium]|nr:hypothetical protein [Clostridia bacterium]
MRNALLLILLLPCLLLTGCRAQTAPPAPLQLAPAFIVNAEILCGNASMKATLRRSADQALCAEFSDPPAIRPLTVRLAQGVCSVRYGEMNVTAAPERMPQTLALSLLADVWETIARRADLTRTLTGGVWTINGSGDHGAFVFTYDAATGAPLTLSIEHASLHVQFDHYQPG